MKTWEERLVALLDGFKDDNMTKFREENLQYRELVQEEVEAQRRLDQIRLTEAQREAAMEVIEKQSVVDSKLITESYLQGIRDSLRTLKFFTE